MEMIPSLAPKTPALKIFKRSACFSTFLKPNRQNWTSTYDVERKEFDDHDKVPLLGSSNGIV